MDGGWKKSTVAYRLLQYYSTVTSDLSLDKSIVDVTIYIFMLHDRVQIIEPSISRAFHSNYNNTTSR